MKKVLEFGKDRIYELFIIKRFSYISGTNTNIILFLQNVAKYNI